MGIKVAKPQRKDGGETADYDGRDTSKESENQLSSTTMDEASF